MQTIKIDIDKITKEQIDLIANYLKRGLVIAYPTDTIYGLGCDARNASAIKKIKKIKRQSAFAKATADKKDNKPFLVLIGDYEMLKKYCVVSAEQLEYLKETWPLKPPLNPSFVRRGTIVPVTVILENRNNLPDELTGGLDGVAVRLPKSEFLIKIIKQAGFPIVSTSLNKTGEQPLKSAWNLEKYFTYLPDLVIDAGECANAKPSRLVDLRDVRNIKVIRE